MNVPARFEGVTVLDIRVHCRLAAAAAVALLVTHVVRVVDASPSRDAARLADTSSGADWAGYGRTFGEQHFSPLEHVSSTTVSRLGLAWSMDLELGNSATIPLAVDGILYFSTGLSVLHAVDAATGKPIWKYDPRVAEMAGKKLRQGWGARGIGYWNGKVFVGTGDGRLIAVDAGSGKQVWSTLTVNKDDYRGITGAPRLFDGKVIIGHAGADSSDVRGYVTAYDAETGRQIWRFYLVPGDPDKGFENDAMAQAAKTWSGTWWQYGGGGNAWNAFAYDAAAKTVFVGTGNGAPWNHKIRSAGQGDNLFLCSIVALDADTGAYKWHYQINPGETWDYNAAMDMHLADLVIAGKPRKVLLQAPKNGFLYVIDRTNGKLVSAEKIAKITWASRIDVASGRPVETPGARFPNGTSFELWPGQIGAHSWMPSAYSPPAQLMFIPLIERGEIYSDRGIEITNWKRVPGNAGDVGLNLDFSADIKDPLQNTGWLIAVDPVTQTIRWKVRREAMWNGGVLATAGNVVFQGTTTGTFDAYEAGVGKRLWSFPTQAPVLAAPITYMAGGRQYVTVLTGLSLSAAMYGKLYAPAVDYRSQARRVLTFALDANATLPTVVETKVAALPDPGYRQDQVSEFNGLIGYMRRCASCHGLEVVAAGAAPDLRASPMTLSSEAFDSVVRGGARVPLGMPRFEELTDAELGAIRQYVRSQTAKLRSPN